MTNTFQKIIGDLLTYVGVSIGVLCAFMGCIIIFTINIIIQIIPITIVIGVIFVFLRIFGVI